MNIYQSTPRRGILLHLKMTLVVTIPLASHLHQMSILQFSCVYLIIFISSSILSLPYMKPRMATPHEVTETVITTHVQLI